MMVCVSRAWRTHVRMGERFGERRETYLLRTLLLSQHLLLLCHDFCLVFQAECERKSHEQRARGDDPDEVADESRAALDERCGGRDA